VFSSSSFLPFLLATVLLSLVPGPATALVIRSGATVGLLRTLPVIAGAELGVYAWALLAAAGISGVVAASPAAFVGLKVAGTVVLVYLGVQAWRTVDRDPALLGDPPVRRWAGFTTGAVTNLANPKLMVFCLAFFPQFLPPGIDPFLATAVLAAVTVVVDIGYFVLLAAVVTRAKTLLNRRRVRVTMDRTAGTVFLALAARTATLTR
jgi:threonine/homoserine/homoserine lactone efflux protein